MQHIQPKAKSAPSFHSSLRPQSCAHIRLVSHCRRAGIKPQLTCIFTHVITQMTTHTIHTWSHNCTSTFDSVTAAQGIGAATASAMLTAFHPSLPFLSDEAAAAVLSGSPKYTIQEWKQIAEALRKKASDLSSSTGSSSTPLHCHCFCVLHVTSPGTRLTTTRQQAYVLEIPDQKREGCNRA